MKVHVWDKEKNEWLKKHREISFERIVKAVENRFEFIEAVDHPNQLKYPGQRVNVVNISHYCYIVPYVEDSEKVFLKTIFRSRKATKKYLVKKGRRTHEKKSI